MVVARIQGAALFAHAGGVCTAGSITRVHGSAGTVVIYTASSFGTTWQELFESSRQSFECGSNKRAAATGRESRVFRSRNG
jgi:hypothetical protein